MPGCVTSASPVLPKPWTRFTTPGGRPASSSSSTIFVAQAGVSSAGLSTTVLPLMRAGKSFHAGIAVGKFHGVMQPKTPIGTRTDLASLFGSSDGTVSPESRRPSPAM